MLLHARPPGGLPGLFLRVYLPFAGAYFLSYLYRTVNAVVGPLIATDLNLSAGELGLLSSAYFIMFAAVQLPSASRWIASGRGAYRPSCY